MAKMKKERTQMAEPFFGAAPQLWTGAPVPGFGYFSAIPGNRLPMIANPASPDPGPSAGGSWAAVPSMSLGGGAPVPATQDFGIAPQALLAAVALRRGQPMGPTNDQEIEDFICDALDLLPGTSDVEVRCDAGRAMLTGSVAHKRVKRDVGEIAWAIPNVTDVQNTITIAQRRRSRVSGRETDTTAATTASRKQG
jgi:hypothetical protein